QDFAEGDGAAGVADDLLDRDDVAGRDLVLFPAGADDREHDPKSLNSLYSRPDPCRAGAGEYTDRRGWVKAAPFFSLGGLMKGIAIGLVALVVVAACGPVRAAALGSCPVPRGYVSLTRRAALPKPLQV